MNHARKTFALWLVFAFCLTLAPATALADSDAAAPVIGETLTVSPTVAQPDGTITISVEATDDSEVDYVEMRVYSPQGATIGYDRMARQGASNLYQCTYTVPANAVNGYHMVDISAFDIYGNGSGKAFANAFEVTGGSSDTTPPVIGETLTVSPTVAQPGEMITISVEATDDSELDYVEMRVYSPQGSTIGYDRMARQGASNTYQCTYTVPVNATNGYYKIDISAVDIYRNGEGKLFANAFEVAGGSSDAAPPVIGEALTVSPATVQPGGTITIGIEVTDDSEIERVEMRVYNPQGATIGYDVMARQGASNLYQCTYTAPINAANGYYKIDISTYDIYRNGNGKTFENAFEVAYQDQTPPAIALPTVSPKKLEPGETLSVSAAITDLSGVSRASVYLIAPNQAETRYILTKDSASDVWGTDVTLPSDAPAGVWNIRMEAFDWQNNRSTRAFNNAFTVSIPYVFVESVSLKPSTALAVNQTETLGVTVTPNTATNQAVTWSSSKAGVAKVDSSGKVTAVAAGTAIIRATATDGSGLYGECAVTVTKPPVVPGENAGGKPAVVLQKITDIKFAQSTLYLEKGKAGKVPVAAYTGDGSPAKLTYSSSNAKVATVTAGGKIQGRKAGAAVITVKGESGKAAKLTVKVVDKKKAIKATEVKIGGKASITLKKGKTKTLKATVSPKTATGAVIKWASKKKSVATVDLAGKVTALKKGTAVITATAGGKRATITVKVV